MPDEQDIGYVQGVFPVITEIESPALQRSVAEVLAELWHESPWTRIEDCPKQPEKYPASVKMYDYVRKIAALALSIAETLEGVGAGQLDRDTLIAGALLQDASKLLEYCPEGVSEHGKLIQHGVYAAHKAWAKGIPERIVHGIIAHTPESRVRPATPEAILLSYVELLLTDLLRGVQREMGH